MLFGADQWPGGQNLMCTPKIYRQLFEIIPSPNFGLNFDPSHYVWQGPVSYTHLISAAKKEITTLEGALQHQQHHLRPLSPDRRQVRHHRLPGGAGHPPPDRAVSYTHLDVYKRQAITSSSETPEKSWEDRITDK